MKNPRWAKYKDLCDLEPRELPVEGGKRMVALYQIKPRGNLQDSNKAFVFAHQGGGLMFDAEMFLEEGFRYAVELKSPVFFVDFWKERIKAPMGAKDFAEAIEYINNNSAKFGIQKDCICVAGSGAGAWAVLGAMNLLIARKNISIIKAAFYISPIVDDVLGKVELSKLQWWEEIWKEYNKSFFRMMATNYDKQQKDSNLYPLRAANYRSMPPSVIFTSEFDYNRREAILLKDKLEQGGKLLDFSDIPGVGQMYHYDCNLPQSFWFFKDIESAFEKFVKNAQTQKKPAN